MGFYGDVKPGDDFEPSASLSNDVRHFLNRLNGFGGGPITAGNPGIIRIPVYNATSDVLEVGKAVSIDISGTIANSCYPAIAFSDMLPCYGVLVKDLDPAEAGDCILSGLGVVQIASTPATGNYALPGTGGVFVRGDDGVPILNVSGTAAVVMLGAVKTSGGGPAPTSEYNGPFKIEYIKQQPNGDLLVSVYKGNVSMGHGGGNLSYTGGLVTIPYNTAGRVYLHGFRTVDHAGGVYTDFCVDAIGTSTTKKGYKDEFQVELGQISGGRAIQIQSGDVVMPHVVTPTLYGGLRYPSSSSYGNDKYNYLEMKPAINGSRGGVMICSNMISSYLYVPDKDAAPTVNAVSNFVSDCVLSFCRQIINTNNLYDPFQNERSDFLPPSSPTISANITSATNGAVVLTANYSSDSVQKQYSIDGGNFWNIYPSSGGVQIESNGIVYFRGIDSYGNISPAGQYEVSNIDKETPMMPTIFANTAPTSSAVKVTAAFAGDAKKNEYSIDGGSTWTNYPSGGVQMASNGTVIFRTVDSAGNSASRSYAVTNIINS